MKNDKIHLIGKYGEIKSLNDTTCKATITDSTVARRYKGKSGRKSSTSVSVIFKVKDLATWIKRLAINTTADGNIRLGSDFFE